MAVVVAAFNCTCVWQWGGAGVQCVCAVIVPFGDHWSVICNTLQLSVAVCCSVLQCVVQCVAECCRECCSVLQ